MDKPIAVIFSGAGLSAESGIPTFRDNNGLWHNHKVEDVADPDGWKADPQLVLDFYAERWHNIKKCEPNEAHKAIARLQKEYNVINITQNIDDLLERAGCTNIMHLHGCIDNRKCEWHKDISNLDGDMQFTCDYKEKAHKSPVTLGEKCPKCNGQMRPDVVWFKEAVDMQEKLLEEIAAKTEVFIGVGTSAQVHPAAGLLYTFSKAKKKYFIDLNPPLRLHSFTRLTGKASEHLPKVVNELLLTKKYITSIKIADEINQWLHRKGDDVQNYEHFLDRVMDIRAIVEIGMDKADKFIQENQNRIEI